MALLTFVTRYLTDTVGAIKDDLDAVTGLPGNVVQAGERVGDATSDLISSTLDNGLDVVGAADSYQDKTARRESFAQMTAEQLDVIANPHKYSEEEKQAVANQYNQTYADIRGIESADTNFFAEGDLNEETAVGINGVDKRDTVAFTDGNADNNDIYYEADRINEGDNFAQALGHENSRHDQAEKGYDNQTTDGFSTAGDEQAIKAGLHNVSAMNREMGYKGVKSDADTTVSYVRTDYDKAIIKNGTIKADQVEEVDPLANFVVGAVAGAGIDYAIQVAQNKFEGKDWSDALTEIDKESLAISAGTGAAGVGLVSKLQKLNKLQKAGKVAKAGTAAGAEATIDGADSIARQVVNGGDVNLAQVGKDVVVGQVLNGAGSGVKKADTVKGYRAVSDAEFDDINATGKLRPDPNGNSMEDKWFAETKEGAEKFQSNYSDLTSVVEVDVPSNVYNDAYKNPNIDNCGPGFCVDSQQLQDIRVNGTSKRQSIQNQSGSDDVVDGVLDVSKKEKIKSKDFYFNTKRQALRQAKRDAGIPTSVTHVSHKKGVQTDRLGGKGTDLYFDSYNGNNNKLNRQIVQDHSSGHNFVNNPKPPHFNNHPKTKNHYVYDNR